MSSTPAELEFPYSARRGSRTSENGEELPIVPDAFADQYRTLMREHIEALQSKCSEARIDYVLIDTSKPLDNALFQYLGNRQTVNPGAVNPCPFWPRRSSSGSRR